MLDSKLLQFEPFITYETILCSFFLQSQKINAACIGVNFTPTEELFLHVYDDTDTKLNLQVNAFFSLNFCENFTYYAIAALRGKHKGDLEPEFELDMFSNIHQFPILNDVWCCIGCQVIELGPFPFQTCKRRQMPNIKAKIIEKKLFHFPKLINNRAFNLAIEALIRTTRIPICNQYSDQYTRMLNEYKEIKKTLQEWRDFDRFRDGFQLMDNYMLSLNVKSSDLFHF